MNPRWMMLVATMLLGIAFAAAEATENGNWLESDEIELRIEATYRMNETSGVSSIEYSKESLEQIDRLVNQRTRKLMSRYCGNLNRQLARFAREHGPAETMSDSISPEDAHAVAETLLQSMAPILINLTHPAHLFVSSAMDACRGMVRKETPPEHISLWSLVCMTTSLATTNASASYSQLPEATRSGMDALHSIMACPQEMVDLARAQLEVEYQRDGVTKAARASGIDADKAAQFLEQNPIPDRAAFRARKRATMARPPHSTGNGDDDDDNNIKDEL